MSEKKRKKVYVTLPSGDRVEVIATRVWHVSLAQDRVPEDNYWNPIGSGATRVEALARFVEDAEEDAS